MMRRRWIKKSRRKKSQRSKKNRPRQLKMERVRNLLPRKKRKRRRRTKRKRRVRKRRKLPQNLNLMKKAESSRKDKSLQLPPKRIKRIPPLHIPPAASPSWQLKRNMSSMPRLTQLTSAKCSTLLAITTVTLMTVCRRSTKTSKSCQRT